MKHDIDTVRHSTAHVMAAAVKNLFPNTKLGIGPTIENGFYYDFESPHKFTEPDLVKIESEMQKIIKQNVSFERMEKNINEAVKLSKKIDEPYKQELISDLKEKGERKVSFYKTGNFIDLCKGPHVGTTQDIGYYKLLNIAGAYWKGSENNQMLTRIYGTVWPTKKELEEHVSQLEEIKKRDHKKLGRELELFMFRETAPGMPYWLPKGLIIYNELLSLWRRIHRKNEYQEIASPVISEKKLWETSGHWKYYKEDMFVIPVDKNTTYSVKPMNCPDAMVVFGSKTRSYKDLPLRLADTDILHRFEKSGTLNGLLRVRKFQQDDAHVFVTEDQIEEEYVRILKIADYLYSIFNLKYRLRLGTRPEKFLGARKVWDKAESTLKSILKRSGEDYFILEGDGVFYGPKIDILMKDTLGREWQMGTLQLDFQLPARFKLKYTNSKGQPETPVVIHRAIYGSIDRFIGILIEHYGGAFPVWISPVQAIIIPISERHLEYAKTVKKNFLDEDLRVEIDGRSETMQSRIRDAQLQKIPYIIVVGDKEQVKKTISVRKRDKKELQIVRLEEFIQKIKTIIRELKDE